MPTPNWSALTLPEWMSWPLVGTAVVALVSSGDVAYLAHNLVLIFAAPYFFLGLAVVHSLARLAPRKGFFVDGILCDVGVVSRVRRYGRRRIGCDRAVGRSAPTVCRTGPRSRE
jgi:hypothetical protein